jgi:hypothetical protein
VSIFLTYTSNILQHVPGRDGGERRAPEVSNTLWAFTTRGKKPGEWPVGQLERRAEVISGEFNSQKHQFENISEHVQEKKILFLRLCNQLFSYLSPPVYPLC